METLVNRVAGNRKDYLPLPFWSWNDKLEAEELKRQIRWMHENDVGGFFMHARGGLKTEYLSDDWMDCIKACCEEANNLEMQAWAYDENGWPSGFVGGELLEEESNRDKYLVYHIGAFDEAADISYFLDAERLIRVSGLQSMEGEYLNLYIKTSASTVDILNPDVVEQFLGKTHRKYKEKFGDTFPNKIKGFFTDEPQYYRWGTPYTPMMVKYFQEEYRQDIFEQLGLLFVEKEGYQTFRYRYWCGMQKLMLENWAKKVYDWCEQNQIKLTGHYIEETTLGYQIMCCGGVMPFYEYEHIPGIDWLHSVTGNELSPRQVGSAARQLGKKQVITESFAACGWDVTPAQLRRIAGFQYANGVNMLCLHLMPYSEHGQRKRDYPAHFNQLNPWVKEHFKEFNDYFSNLGYLLAEGEEPVNVAMLHPIRSAYLDYKRDQEQFCIRELEEKLSEAMRLFSSRGIAYHFLDETLLEQHGFVEGAKIGCGECSYTYLVLPKIITMGAHTENLIHQFIKNGGKVLLLDDSPQYLEGELFSYSYLQSNCTLEDIEHTQPFQVTHTDTELYYAYRIFDGKPFIFVQNSSSTKRYTQTFQFEGAIGSFLALDPVSMCTKKLPLTVSLEKDEALLLFPIEEEEAGTEEREEVELQFKEAEIEFQDNYMTVDVVQYSEDGEQYSDPILIYELFQQLLKERYEGVLWLRYDFEIRTLPEQLSLISESKDALGHRINGQEFSFTKNWDDEQSFMSADVTALVRQGINSYEVEMNWHQSEKTYYALFGENVTESLKNCIAYDSEIEAIYLCGRFGVYSPVEFEHCEDDIVCSERFYVGEIPKTVTEPVLDGFPFFRGKLTLRQEIVLDNKNVVVKLPGHYLTAKVWVNGQEAGELLFDRKIDISAYAHCGSNDIKVEFTIGNRNFLGPFHMEGVEGFIGPGSFEECTLPRSADGHYRYKFHRFYSGYES